MGVDTTAALLQLYYCGWNRRVQVSENFGNQGLQTKASAGAITQQIAADPTAGDEWKSLANVFAQGEMVAATVKQQQDTEARDAAHKYANSMTVGLYV